MLISHDERNLFNQLSRMTNYLAIRVLVSVRKSQTKVLGYGFS